MYINIYRYISSLYHFLIFPLHCLFILSLPALFQLYCILIGLLTPQQDTQTLILSSPSI